MNSISNMACTCLISTLIAVGACAAHAETQAKMPGIATASLPTGTFVVVDTRRASDVAATLPPDMADQMPIGEEITFNGDAIEMRGIGCDDWQIHPDEETPDYLLSDPNLIDIVLGPTDSPISSGDKRLNQYFNVSCEGEFFASILQIDNRVLILPWANSAINLVLERALTSDQVRQYQRQLKSMKFYSGPLNGTLDEATLAASRRWYDYRARLEDDQPLPARPAITENLLDALGVLER